MPVKKTATKAAKKSAVKKSAPKKKKAVQKVEVAFSLYAPDAYTVAVGGTFNDWDHNKDRMNKGDGGRWTKILELAPGRYEYLFRINDTRWEQDQDYVETVQNEFGTVNCVKNVI